MIHRYSDFFLLFLNKMFKEDAVFISKGRSDEFK